MERHRVIPRRMSQGITCDGGHIRDQDALTEAMVGGWFITRQVAIGTGAKARQPGTRGREEASGACLASRA